MTASAPTTVKLTRRSHGTPLLKTQALVGATLPVRDPAASKVFYEEVLGLEVRQPAEDRLLIRLSGDHVYEAEKVDEDTTMPILKHNGVNSRGDVAAEHAVLEARKDEYGIQKITKPIVQHGTYGFYLQDRDGNWWEVNRAYDGPMDHDLEDLSDRPDMSIEAARERLGPDSDLLAHRVEAYRAAHRDDCVPTKPSIFQTVTISHGTLEASDLQATRNFYEQVLGLKCFQQSAPAIMTGLGTDHRYVVVQTKDPNMERYLRNRLLFETEADLRAAHEALGALEGSTVSELTDPAQHDDGRVSFEFRDLDRNWWEPYYDPQGPPSRYFD